MQAELGEAPPPANPVTKLKLLFCQINLPTVEGVGPVQPGEGGHLQPSAWLPRGRGSMLVFPCSGEEDPNQWNPLTRKEILPKH